MTTKLIEIINSLGVIQTGMILFAFFVIPWFFFSLVVGFIAIARKRSFILWFLISILLSPLVGIIIFLILEKDQKIVPQPPSKNQNETRECPFCAEKIKKAAVLCRYCNREITSGRSSSTEENRLQVPIEENWENKMKKRKFEMIHNRTEKEKQRILRGKIKDCPVCGQLNKFFARYCFHCNSQFQTPQSK